MIFLLGPFFEMFKVLNKVFGYRQNDKEDYDAIVEADIAYFRQEKGLKMRKGVKLF